MNLDDQREGPHRGCLFVLEGPDGVGKSTLAAGFSQLLRRRGTDCRLMAFPGRAPGSLGHHVYCIHHDPGAFGIERVEPTSLQLLHIAAHIDALELQIRPLLKAGVTIVLDRYWWSTWVYGMEADVPQRSLEAMIELERQHWNGLAPEAIFLVLPDRPFATKPDTDWFARLSARYRSLVSDTEDQVVHLLANEGTVDEEVARMVALLDDTTLSGPLPEIPK